MQHAEKEHAHAIDQLTTLVTERLDPFVIGNVPVDGASMVYLIQELVSQISNGGTQFNMVSATEAMVSNMAKEAAQKVWSNFMAKVKRLGYHPDTLSSKRPLGGVLKEIEACAHESIRELEAFVNRLVPREPASIAKTTWY